MVDVRDQSDIAKVVHSGVYEFEARREDAGGSIVVVVLVVVEGDPVALGDRGVFVVLRRTGGVRRACAEAEGFGPPLLQLARFFEAAMATLLHGRAPDD